GHQVPPEARPEGARVRGREACPAQGGRQRQEGVEQDAAPTPARRCARVDRVGDRGGGDAAAGGHLGVVLVLPRVRPGRAGDVGDPAGAADPAGTSGPSSSSGPGVRSAPVLAAAELGAEACACGEFGEVHGDGQADRRVQLALASCGDQRGCGDVRSAVGVAYRSAEEAGQARLHTV
ncbi:MAG: hypothetical protein AVDCRST_MAG68-5095, partial [uncultured Gemmatimonadetes bacterium]